MPVGGYIIDGAYTPEEPPLKRRAAQAALEFRKKGPMDQRAAVDFLGRRGLLGFIVPAEYGGAVEGRPFDTMSLCLIREGLGAHAPELDAAFIGQGLGGMPIVLSGSEEQKQRYLPPLARGEILGALALTEAEAGSDLGGIRTRAEAAGGDGDGGYMLDGSKRFISNGGLADFYVLCAATDPSQGSRGLTAFIVDGDTPGLTATPREMITDHPTGDLELAGCLVPRAHRIGREGEGFKVAAQALEVLRITVGAFAVGLAERALRLSLQRVQERIQFGRPLARFQAIRFKLADMAVRLRAARLMVYSAAAEKDAGGGRVSLASSMAKLHATEAAFQVVNEAVQIFGGDGVTRGHEVEKLYREVRPPLIYEGTSEIQRLIIAGRLLEEAQEKPPEGLP